MHAHIKCHQTPYRYTHVCIFTCFKVKQSKMWNLSSLGLGTTFGRDNHLCEMWEMNLFERKKNKKINPNMSVFGSTISIYTFLLLPPLSNTPFSFVGNRHERYSVLLYADTQNTFKYLETIFIRFFSIFYFLLSQIRIACTCTVHRLM